MKKKIKARRKGTKAEQELVNILKSNGVGARRVTLSGALTGEKGDLKIKLTEFDYSGSPFQTTRELQAEVKKYKRKFQEYSWLSKDNSDLVFKRSDGEDWLAVLPIKLFVKLVK